MRPQPWPLHLPTWVSLAFLKGMWGVLLCRALMTSPSADNDLLMACASFSCAPTTSDLSTRSEPGAVQCRGGGQGEGRCVRAAGGTTLVVVGR